MKTSPLSLCSLGVLTTALLLLPAGLQAQLQSPTITSVRQDQTNCVVTVDVPPGLLRVTLESRERLSRSTWEPRSIARLDGTGGQVTFRLPLSRTSELLRVRADASEPLPASFYAGITEFAGEQGTDDRNLDLAGGGIVTFDSSGTPPPSTEEKSREVVESDIWQVDGNTLYFFNQNRGLQVIDLTNPDQPVLRGNLSLSWSGEQMYLLDSSHVVLLARDSCQSEQSEIVIVTVSNFQPVVTSRLPVAGRIVESRLVGSALYVASELYRALPATTNTAWEWGSSIAGFDLANPTSPQARNTLWYSGYGNVVSATDTFLFLALQHPTSWWRSTVEIVDITAPDGTLKPYAAQPTAGQIKDKFKINYHDQVLTTISEDWRGTNGVALVTRLETFRLPHPISDTLPGIVKLGEVQLGGGERLRGTRFDGSRVYVVTFFQIDPLWVVDLADPSKPRIAGSVEVPGFSTYLQPLGERLLTVGVETNRVAVSLFHVGDPSAPRLLSRVLLGERYSWSEANTDEKAFTVLPGAGLVLVPYNGDFTDYRPTSAIQLIDLGSDSLTARGRIESPSQIRRATLCGNRMISVSGWELLSVDITDRDHPLVSGMLELTWTVDRVFLASDYLVQVGSALDWNNASPPVLHVTPTDAADQLLTRLELPRRPLLGAEMKHDRLYIAQGGLAAYPLTPVLLEDGTPAPKPGNFLLTVIDLSALPELAILNQTEVETQPLAWSGWQAVWPRPNLLVWVGTSQFTTWYYPYLIRDVITFDGLWYRPWYGSGTAQLLAFDLSEPAKPEFVSETNLATNGWSGFSKAFAADGMVYLSHNRWEYPVVIQPTQSISDPTVTEPSSDVVGLWAGYGYRRTWLDVVDYRDAHEPLVRTPVNIPGNLAGVSHNGAVVYTISRHWDTNIYVCSEYLDASAYDGVLVHLVDSLPLSTAWQRPVLISGDHVFLGRSGEGVDATGGTELANTLETWRLSRLGKFELLDSVPVAAPVTALAVYPQMLATRSSLNDVTLYDATDPAALRRVGSGDPANCGWFDLGLGSGDLKHGLWLPLGSAGVGYVGVEF